MKIEAQAQVDSRAHDRIPRLLIGAAALGLLIWSLLPYWYGRIVNAGVVATVAVTVPCILLCLWWKPAFRFLRRVWTKRGGRAVLILVAAVTVILLGLFVAASACMLHAAVRPTEAQATVIVLGAAVRPDGPSAMLADRLDAAARYLKDNPQSVCIVSGGKGPDEPAAEADVMYDYLVNRGIALSRLYREDESRNTDENIRFSREIIEREHLNNHVVIATQEFHQYRAQSLAKAKGLNHVSPCTCRTKRYLLECYWVREFAAVCRLWLLGR